jgi:hypothetical protein
LSTKSEQTETDAPKKAESSSSEAKTKYSKERLLADGHALTGYRRHIIAGALDGKTGDLTIDQVKSACEKFLNSEVKEG